LDCWTSKNQIPFLGITIHYVDINWELKHFLLDFSILLGPHSGENLALKFLEILKNFNIATKVNYIYILIIKIKKLFNKIFIIDFSNNM